MVLHPPVSLVSSRHSMGKELVGAPSSMAEVASRVSRPPVPSVVARKEVTTRSAPRGMLRLSRSSCLWFSSSLRIFL